MGIKSIVKRAGSRAADTVARLAVLSPEQVEKVREQRDAYLSEMPKPDDPAALVMTERLLAANAVEIYNAYLPQLQDFYRPVSRVAEYGGKNFSAPHNSRYINITRWVCDASENSIEKLANVYSVLSDEDCNIALIFHRSMDAVRIFLAVSNLKNDPDNVDADNYKQRLEEAIRGNFPGSTWSEDAGVGMPPALKDINGKSVACLSNIPTEKSEGFSSQTIEKLLDGVVPASEEQEYTIVLLASPIRDVDERILRLGEIYSGLAPYASWETGFTFTENRTESSGAQMGVNVGASAGVQAGTNQSSTLSEGTTDSESGSVSDSMSSTEGASTSHATGENSSSTEGASDSINGSVTVGVNSSSTFGGGFSVAPLGIGPNASASTTIGGSLSGTVGTGHTTSSSQTFGQTVSDTVARSTSETVGRAVTNTLGRAVTSTLGKTAGTTSGHSFGANFGMNFSRLSNVTVAVGKNESITQSFQNYQIRHALELLEEQMKRYDEASALGMWDFAAYVLSKDANIANNVAHSYLALTQGEQSHLSKAAVSLWMGDRGEGSNDAREICSYLQELRQPLFSLSPELVAADQELNVYPAVVTSTTPLSGKELALALNFPKHSLPGFPVLECAAFGRSVTTYEDDRKADSLSLGKVFHMHREEPVDVQLDMQSLASHVFVTGSTGAGKTNTICRMLDQAMEKGVGFLVIEPAKGEYKDVYGGRQDVSVFGTNADVAPLLRLDPFSFPSGIHILEHLDRLVEVFNVCWPMYAAMPAVLKDAIERSYIDCGWDLAESENPFGGRLFPTMADVARNVRDILDESDYDAENKGAYKGSLLTRLNSLTNGINGLIFSTDEIDGEALFDSNVIIDLSRVGSMETKSLLMGLIVLKLQEQRMAAGEGANQALRHLTVLEEAHNILKRTSTDQPVEGGNLIGKSVEMLSNAIAEMRSYGEGFVIADQAPGLLDMAVIRNTNTKIILRLPDLMDRELVGRAASLNDEQIVEVARLPMGVAVVYQNNWIQPVLCKVAKASTGSRLVYKRQRSFAALSSSTDALMIADMLSKGESVSGGAKLEEIRAAMNRIGLTAYAKVLVLQSLASPFAEPRMTKLGPIMSSLFPSVKEAVVRSRRESAFDPQEWTRGAARELANTVGIVIAEQTRRDIIQAIITDYVYNEQRDAEALQDWANRGGLR